MSKKSKNKRYKTIIHRGIKGIRKDLKSGTFYVEKYIRGQRFNATFSKVQDAADWKKNFHPGLSLNQVSNSKLQVKAQKRIQEIESKMPKSPIRKINGNDLGLTFSDVWELYKEKHLSTIGLSTRDKRLREAIFYSELMEVKMIDFNAALISELIMLKKEEELSRSRPKRFSFNNDLKNLKAVLNWYREKYDEQFVTPILKRHYEEGFVKKAPKKKKKMKKHELLAFFDALESDSLFWRDFAETQFFFSSRVQEVAGLLRSSVDFVSKTIDIENVMVWSYETRKFLYLKDSPKNDEDREVSMNARVFEIIQRRFKHLPSGKWHTCPQSGVTMDLVFHIDGRPLSYREIQYRYNKALKKAGLSHKYSSTHIMRHTMANMVRSECDLDSAQAVGGWKTRDLVENVYTDMPVHIAAKARQKIESFLYEEDEKTPPENFQKGLKLIKA